MIKYTYIVPTYNRLDTLKETLSSIYAQDRKDFEVIVVDDGSTDDTSLFFKDHSFENLKYIYKENEGVSKARIFGVDYSTTNYIIFVDSDDTVTKDQLTIFDGLIDEDPTVDFYFTAYNFWNSKDDKLIKRENLKEGHYSSFFSDFIRGIQPCFPGCVCIKKNIFNNSIKFKIGKSFGEDQALWIDLFATKKSFSTNKVSFNYRVDSGSSLSKQRLKDISYDVYIAFEKIDNPEVFEYFKYRISSFLYLSIRNLNVALFKKTVSLIIKSKINKLRVCFDFIKYTKNRLL